MALMRNILASTILALTPTFAALPALAETTLIYNAFLPRHDEVYQIAIKDFAAAIEKETAGEVKITIPDTSLAPSDRQYEMVRDGIADIAMVSSGAAPQLAALNQIADLPMHSPSARAASVALWETYQKFFEEKKNFAGVKLLSTHVLPGRQVLLTGKTVIDSADDFSGVKLWSPPGSLSEVAKLLGAVPVNSEFTDLQEYVNKGTVDGIIMTSGSANGARVLENVTSVTKVEGGLGSLSFAIFISEDRWNELTEAQQAGILRAAEGLPGRTGAAGDAEELELAPQMEKLPTHLMEGDNLAKVETALQRRIEGWTGRAKERGIDNPDEVIAFYRAVLERELANSPAH